MESRIDTRDYWTTGLVILCILVLTQALFFKFSNSLQVSFVLDTVSDWLLSVSIIAGWAEVLRTYGSNVMASIGLAIIFFLLIPPLRRVGTTLGLIIATVSLLIYVLISFKVSFWGSVSNTYALIGLSISLWLACFLLIRIDRDKQLIKPPLPEWKQTVEKELADAVMVNTPITDFVKLEKTVTFDNVVTFEVNKAFGQLLFDVKRELSDTIMGVHQKAFIETEKRFDSLPNEQKYFPHRPMIIPKLLRAVNNEESTKKELVEVIGQDPTMAGELLKVANSPYYRLSDNTVNNIGRAIVVLGVDGLRLLVSTLVLQPVAQTDNCYFSGFTKQVWIQAVIAANAAQAYARKTRSCDSFTAHLLGLLSSIGHIVVFHTLLDVYKNYPGVRPKIEVLNKLTKNHADEISAAVVEGWGLPNEFVETLKANQLRGEVNDLTPLGRALYYGRLCAMLFKLFEKGCYSDARVRFVVHQQGLHDEVFEAMWMVLNSGEESLSEVWG